MFDLKKSLMKKERRRKQDLDSPQMIEANKKKFETKSKQVQIKEFVTERVIKYPGGKN